MERNKLIKSDAYWSAKLNTLLYHKNYKGADKQKTLITELLTLKNELIEACEGKKDETSDESVEVCDCGKVAECVTLCDCCLEKLMREGC